jgi:WD40 repeat protein
MLDTLTQLPNGDIERWNLSTGAPEAIPAPTAATAYQWSGDGALSSAGSAVGQPIGEPNGGRRFTIWQPGSLQYEALPPDPSHGSAANTHTIQWSANLSPVSPDGRYFYPNFLADGSLIPPSTQPAFPHETPLEPHDAALLALAMTQAVAPAPNMRTLVAWRPDGRQMAALTANSAAPTSDSAFTISIYDTRTGKVVKRLTPDLAGLRQGDGGTETLAWSPDGSHLLLADNVYGSITIWGPGALPA